MSEFSEKSYFAVTISLPSSFYDFQANFSFPIHQRYHLPRLDSDGNKSQYATCVMHPPLVLMKSRGHDKCSCFKNDTENCDYLEESLFSRNITLPDGQYLNLASSNGGDNYHGKVGCDIVLQLSLIHI